jgi:transposase
MGGFCPGDGVRWEFIPKADKRGEAEALFSQGRSVSEVSKDLGISLGTVKTWRTNWAKKGKPTKLVMSGSDPIRAAGVQV